MRRALLVTVLWVGCRTPPFGATGVPSGGFAEPDAAIASHYDLAVAADLATAVVDLATACPSALPPKQTVTFRIRNAAASERWLVTVGNACDAFSIPGVVQALQQACICECPALPTPFPAQLQHLAAGDTTTLTWDARSMATCTEEIDCSSWGGGKQSIQTGALQPILGGGHFHVEFAYDGILPAGCVANGDRAVCSAQANMPDWGTRHLCPSQATAGADFTLPSSGDVAVDVTIN